MTYKRIVLKVSGEFLGATTAALDADRFRQVCSSVESLVDIGVETCVVVGGGNIMRGAQFHDWGVSQSEADVVGMMATGVNAALLSSMLAARGVASPVLMSNGPCSGLGHGWSGDDAVQTLEACGTVIVAGGWGRPLVSTDYPAVAFAAEIGADAVLMAKSGTTGVYDSDPRSDPAARFLPSIPLAEALQARLGVMDCVALEIALQHRVRIHIFTTDDPELPSRICKGEMVGSVLHP
jgi:uridylate kinase